MAKANLKSVSEAAVKALKADLRGEVVLQSDESYATLRKVWNGMIDRYPAMIVRCAGTSDVMKAVKFAHDQGLTVSVPRRWA